MVNYYLKFLSSKPGLKQRFDVMKNVESQNEFFNETTYGPNMQKLITYLQIFGFSVANKKKNIIPIALWNSIVVLHLVLVIIQMVKDAMFLIQDLVFLSIYFSMILSVIIQFDHICNIIETTKSFWDSKSFNFSAQKKYSRRLKLTKILSYFYGGQFASGIVIVMICSPFVNKGSIVLNYFYPESWPYIYNYLFGLISLTIIFLSVMVYDVCIMVYILLLDLQFILLNAYVSELDFGKLKSPNDVEKYLKNEVAILVEQHAFLVRCTKKLVRVLSISFPVMYFSYAFAFCIEIYKNSLGNVSSVELLTSFFYMVGMATRIFVYCIPAQMLNNEAEQINNAIYKSSWYLPNIAPIRRAFVFIMTYGKNGLELKTRYIFSFVINLNSSLVVFRTAYSCYAFLNAATNK